MLEAGVITWYFARTNRAVIYKAGCALRTLWHICEVLAAAAGDNHTPSRLKSAFFRGRPAALQQAERSSRNSYKGEY